MDNPHLIHMMHNIKYQDMIRDAKKYRIAKVARSHTAGNKAKVKTKTKVTFFTKISRWIRLWLHRDRNTSHGVELNQVRES